METRTLVWAIPNITAPDEPITLSCNYESGNIGNTLANANVTLSINNITYLAQYKIYTYETKYTPNESGKYIVKCNASLQGYKSGFNETQFEVAETGKMELITGDYFSGLAKNIASIRAIRQTIENWRKEGKLNKIILVSLAGVLLAAEVYRKKIYPKYNKGA